jgi:predicted nucleic acid-binding Zn finger protein
MDFMSHTHEDCDNFDNGTCTCAPRIFNFTNLDPKGQACPHFKAKKIAETENKKNDLEK